MPTFRPKGSSQEKERVLDSDNFQAVERPADALTSTVLAGGYCIGCGNCAAASPQRIEMSRNALGYVQPEEKDTGALANPMLSTVCPFSNAGPDETRIAAVQDWGETEHDVRIGRYKDIYAGHVSDEGFRLGGGSGGMTTWFVKELLERDEVDFVIHVKPVDRTTDPDGRLFRYAVSSNVEGLQQGRKSRYYPVDLADVYRFVQDNPGRYAVVALPCFAKAVRLMQHQSPVFAERIRFVVGLICGHLKSSEFAEYLGLTQGVRPRELDYLDFRVKIQDADASQYTVEAHGGGHQRSGRPIKEYFGTTWDLGFMKYSACEFCDDVFAEVADIAFGDAWIPPFSHDWRGSNLVVTRHPLASRIVAEGMASGSVTLEPIGKEQAVQTQSSGIAHRRQGLAYRLSLVDRQGLWRPRKRFEEIGELPAKRRRIYEMRTLISRLSAEHFLHSRQRGNLLRFQMRMSRPVFRYYLLAAGLKGAMLKSVPGKWALRTVRSALGKGG